MRYRVVEDWQASYADPIRFSARERVYLTGRQDRWDGHLWLWAQSAMGLEGWIPDDLIVDGRDGPVARDAFDAVELTCRAGWTVTGEHETHGWVRCRSDDGRTGWVPRRNLEPEME